MVTWNYGGLDLWTKLQFVITDPNPDPDLVQIDWSVEGGGAHSGSPPAAPGDVVHPIVATACGRMLGYRTASNTYDDQYDPSISVGKKWTGEVASGSFESGGLTVNWKVDACCRVASITDNANDLTIRLENYLEYSIAHAPSPGSYSPTQYSNTKYSLPKVEKM